MSVGRKEVWPPEAYFEIVQLISEGVNLADAMGETRPAKTSFFNRLREDSELAKAYERALVMRAQGRISKIEEIVAKFETGKIDPQSAKVAIDAMKWLSQKEDPKRYSDVQRAELSGPNGRDLIPDQPRMSDFDLARLAAFYLTRGDASRTAVDCGDLLAIASDRSPPIMIAHNDPLLCSAVSRAVSAFSAVLHEGGGLPAFLRLLDASMTPDENAVIRNASDRRITTELQAEVLKRQAEGCWPHAPGRRQVATA